MPLIAPGVNAPADGADSWFQKLAGKKITESGKTDETNFAKGDLPSGSRVLGEDSMFTMDHRPDRLNVHIDKDGLVQKVRYG